MDLLDVAVVVGDVEGIGGRGHREVANARTMPQKTPRKLRLANAHVTTKHKQDCFKTRQYI